MKKFPLLLISIGLLATTSIASAQGMMGQYYTNTDNSIQPSPTAAATAQDEAKGKAIWEQLQSKQTDCKTLTDDDYDVLGDYFMGLMAGNNHDAMNNRMTLTMGDQGEKQMHIVIGKRFSGCESTAVLPPQYQGFSYLMPTMGGANFQDYPANFQNHPWNNMMGQYAFPGSPFMYWISLILVWTVLVLSIVALINYIRHQKRK